MKETGIEWIGEIPEDWEVTKLKYINDGNLQYGANAEGVDFSNELPRYIRITDITADNKLKDGGKQSLPLEIAKPYLLKGGDILFARSGATVGKTFLFEENFEESAFAGYLIKVRPLSNKAISKFIYYITLGSGYENWKKATFSQATIQNIGADKYGNMFIALPSLIEQKAIADFLNDKVGKLDKAIALLDQEIVKLEEFKKSLITEIVTKGLNPDVVMKDSGVEWVGEIPVIWGVHPLKVLTNKIGSGKTPLGGAEIYLEDGVMLLRSQNVYANGLKLDDVVFIDECTDKQMNNSRVFQHDVLLNITGGSIGRVGYYNLLYSANVNQHVCIIRTKNELLLPKYLYYFLNSNSGQEYIDFNQYGGNREALNFQQIANFMIPVPSIEEQWEIVSVLDSRYRSIIDTSSKLSIQKELLQNIRKSLIFEYVTGKKRINV